MADILRASLDPTQRQQAEDQLTEVQEIIGFPPLLLQVVMTNDFPLPVRQAGAIYLKNLVITSWNDKKSEDYEGPTFLLHEQDRSMLRDAIVDAIVHAPDILKTHLCVCLRTMIKHDFPTPWTLIVDKIHIHLQNPDATSCMGALHCLYQLIKTFEFNTVEQRMPLIEAMNLLLPLMYDLMETLLPNPSEQSMLMQKQLLKCFYSLIKYNLPLDLITKEIFSRWMEILRRVVAQPVPEHTMKVDETERLNLPWWKCKKWAIHVLYRLFGRYGSPTKNHKYAEFAEWYLNTFTGGILDVLFKILDEFRNNIYVSPRVLHQALSYIDQCVSHSHSWKLLKPHMCAIIENVLLPLMSYTKEDKELWETDPHEYIRIKFGIYDEDLVAPVNAAQGLLISCCKKRKEMFQSTMTLCMQVLTNQSGIYGAPTRDGALHMVGAVSDILIKKKYYKDQIDTLVTQFVFPEFNSPLGHMRARACWVLHYFANVKFKNQQILFHAADLTLNALLTDTDLPVKVEAALALQVLLNSQDKVTKYLEPKASAIAAELLSIIRETENDSLAVVLQGIVPMYATQLMPMAEEITDHLAYTFTKVLETDIGSDEMAIAAMGILNTIEVVVSSMGKSDDMLSKLERIVLKVVGHIFQGSVIEYYEEALFLLCILTSHSISEDAWKVLEMVYEIFEKDGGFDYFTDMMPVLHNYVTVSPEVFISKECNLVAIFNMCKRVLSGDVEEDNERYAAKLLEVIVLQYNGKIDNCLQPFVEVILTRLTRNVKTSELRIMLLQVLIAILYCNANLLFNIIGKLQESVPNASITTHFMKQWINDVDYFLGLHDRKLSVLGLCTLLKMGTSRPNIDEIVPKFLPSCLILFDGLKKAYKAQAEAKSDLTTTSDDSSDDDIEDEEVLESDEDEPDDMEKDYTDYFGNINQGDPFTAVYDSDDDDDDDYINEDVTECYTTPLDDEDCLIDEYIVFKSTLSDLSASEPALYTAMMSVLDEKQHKALQAVFVLADQRKAQQDSKRIEQSGGYSFTVPASVPTKFNFGS